MKPSPLELKAITRLRSAKLPEPVGEFLFAYPRRWRFDFAYPDFKIGIELEGGLWIQGRHNSPQGFIKDMEKYNSAALLGWRVFRYSHENLEAIVVGGEESDKLADVVVSELRESDEHALVIIYFN